MNCKSLIFFVCLIFQVSFLTAQRPGNSANRQITVANQDTVQKQPKSPE